MSSLLLPSLVLNKNLIKPALSIPALIKSNIKKLRQKACEEAEESHLSPNDKITQTNSCSMFGGFLRV